MKAIKHEETLSMYTKPKPEMNEGIQYNSHKHTSTKQSNKSERESLIPPLEKEQAQDKK